MAKLTLVFFTAFIISFGFLETIKAEEAVEQEEKAADEDDRSGAYAHASISLRPSQGGLVRPAQLPTSQQGLIQCFTCVDCPEVQPNTMTKWCPRTLDPVKQSSCVTYVEQYKHLKKAWYIRGCASDRGSCSDIKQAHTSQLDVVKLVSCNECEGDRCNGASRSISDMSIAIFTMLVTPLLAKVALS